MKYILNSYESADCERGLNTVFSATPPTNAPKNIFRTLLSRIPLTGLRLFQQPSNQKQIPRNPPPGFARERTSMKRGNENPFHVSDSDTSGRWVNRSVLSRVQHWIYGVLAAGAMASGVSAAEPPLVELLPFGQEGIRTTQETPTDGDLTLEVVFVDFPDKPAVDRSVAHFNNLWAKVSGYGALTQAFRRQGFKGNLAINIRKEWKKMPQNHSYYFQGNGNWNYQDFIKHSGALLGAGPFTSNSIAIVLQDEGANNTGVGAGAHRNLDINGIRTMCTLQPNEYDLYRVLLHEIGHTFGSPDLYPRSGEKPEHLVGGYMMMGDVRGARDFHGWHLFRYGWLAQNRTKFLNKAGTYNIDLKKISNSLGEAMIVIPDPKYAKLWVVEVGRDILKQVDYQQGKNNYLNREGQRLIVYTVEGAPAAPFREIRLAFRTSLTEPLKLNHLSTEWLDAVSYVAGQSMVPGQAPFGLSVTSKTSDGFQIQITLPNDLNGGVYTPPQNRTSPDGKYSMRFGIDGNISIFKTTPPFYHWDAISKSKWFGAADPTDSTRFSYENGTIKRLNNMTGLPIGTNGLPSSSTNLPHTYTIQANVSGPSYLGVNNSGAPEIFPFVQPPPPTLTSISSATGPTGGGTEVTLTGTGFTGDPGVISVNFGGAPATDVSVVNATTIICKTPSRIVGPVNVMITTSGGVNPPNTRFTYFAVTPQQPTLPSILPNTGVTSGGTHVTLYGTGFSGATRVTFGGVAATNLIVLNDLTITCTTPAGTPGLQSVLVNIPGSTSPEIRFFYGATPPPPMLTSATPPTGSNAGGNTVTLSGTGFDAATRVTFGGIEALSFYVVNATTITCTTPARAAGTTSVLVTTPGGTNAANTLFTYVAPSSSATLTTAAYTGSNPTLNGGVLYGFPIVSDTQSSPATLTITSTSAGTVLSGNVPIVGGNNINTGFRTNIKLTFNPGESVVAQTISLTTGQFDDGLRLDYNGLTVLDFDFSNYDVAAVKSMFGGGWSPWTNEGSPALELDAGGLRLMATAVSNGTGAAAGVSAGDRVNVLDYFTSDAYVRKPANPDFVSGVQIGLYSRNNQGAWAISNATMTATARVIASLPLFRITDFRYNPTARTVDVTFLSEPALNYTIETSPNGQTWTVLGAPVPGAAGTATTTVTGRALPPPVTDRLLLRVRRP